LRHYKKNKYQGDAFSSILLLVSTHIPGDTILRYEGHGEPTDNRRVHLGRRRNKRGWGANIGTEAENLESVMKRFAFISRHVPTAEQVKLAKQAGVELEHVGDTDAFSVSCGFVDDAGDFEGVVVVHPAAALRLAPHFVVGVFENGSRPGEDQKPQFYARSFHLYDLRD
jgi:hypothetical protein